MSVADINRVHGNGNKVVQLRDLHGNIIFTSPPTPPPLSGWSEAAHNAPPWNHVRADATDLRNKVAVAAGVLSDHRDAAAAALPGDPWYEPDFPLRVLDNTAWLLGDAGEVELHPVEAALFTLVPLIHHVHHLRVAAALVGVEPWNPRSTAGVRASFQESADHHPALVDRARRSPAEGAAIGWWLFHRWIVRRNLTGGAASPADSVAVPTVADLCDPLGLPSVADPRRIARVLPGLRRGPGVCGDEFLSGLRVQDQVRGMSGQRVREHLLTLVLALAHGMSVEAFTLPDVVAEHLAIPDPVDLDALRATLHEASWGGAPAVPVLRAACPHAAVIEAVRDHVARTDELLHAVHRTVGERVPYRFPVLPARLSAHEVLPADEGLAGWAGFRLDSNRVRDLLVGDTLYKDSELAIRELYQNALDACRYRRARTEYLERTRQNTHAYEGLIEFEESEDEDGRAYVECRDNGIGMGDVELRGVFCKAGSRFAEQPEFLAELAEWSHLDPPVELHPNSRFGVGVLSYFMLAERIVVTTCRVGRDGGGGAVLWATIFGPGHLFRIQHLPAGSRAPGTTVRLYLKQGIRSRSVVHILRQLLGMAEFRTTAVDHNESDVWEPKSLVPVDASVIRRNERRRFDARMVQVANTPPGIDFAWCETAGGVLVDGVVVRTPSSWRHQDLALNLPFVVNLSGRHAPERLSLDRTQIMDDEKYGFEVLAEFTGDTIDLLLDCGLFAYEWLLAVFSASPFLAHSIVDAAMRRRVELPSRFGVVDLAEVGFHPCDAEWGVGFASSFPEVLEHRIRDNDLINATYLWRVFAHEEESAFVEFLEYRGYSRNPATLTAMPMHVPVLEFWSGNGFREKVSISRLVDSIRSTLCPTVSDLIALMALFGFECIRIPEIDDQPLTVGNFVLLHSSGGRPLCAGDQIRAGDIRSAGRRTHMSTDEIVSSWRAAGVEISDETVVSASYVGQTLSAGDRRKFGLVRGKRLGRVRRVVAELRRGTSAKKLCEMLLGLDFQPIEEMLPDDLNPLAALLFAMEDESIGLWRRRPLLAVDVLDAALRLNFDCEEIALALRFLGFETPEVPRETDVRDRRILQWATLWSAEVGLGLDMPKPRNIAEVRRWIERIGELGIRSRVHLPETADRMDEKLFLAVDGYFRLSWISDVLPLLLVAPQAGVLDLTVEDVVARIEGYGLAVSDRILPQGMTFGDATELSRLVYRETSIGFAEPRIDLRSLDEMVHSVGRPLPVVLSWLRATGVHVPDVEKMIDDALKHVPFLG
ncbi:hypothetical protein DFQ13_104394 [Actinokineospora spheciospongiae]|nr:hypothetical protein DFQ13_104394 [Actinokineospora spheciospongiae]